MKRVLFLLPLLAFLGLSVYFAVGLTRDPGTIPSALIDQPAPDVDLPGLPGRDGDFLSAGLAGKDVQIVNVFASWCAPCRIEHPILMRMAEEEGIAVHGINYKDAPEDAQAYLDEGGDPYSMIGVDPDGEAAVQWGVTGVPETFILDRDGRIRYRHQGPILPEQFEQEFLPIMERVAG